MKKILCFSLLSIALFLSSCDSNEGPSVSIDTPVNGANFLPGDTVIFTGTVTDDVRVEQIFISGVTISGSGDRTSVTLSGIELELVEGTPAGEYKYTIRGVDDEGKSGEESVTINVQ